MTTDDLIPPPPRVIMGVEEIILGPTETQERYTNDQLLNQTHLISRMSRFEDVIISVIIDGKKWSYRNGYDYKTRK